jgi:hypothetical protein
MKLIALVAIVLALVAARRRASSRRADETLAARDPYARQQRRDPQRCPRCRSYDIEWRGPGITEQVMSWARFFVDQTLASTTRSRGSPNLHGAGSAGYTPTQRIHDLRVGPAARGLSWRCSRCGEEGRVYE